ncbi:hypothetical protein E2C01_014190 [Portunus trituberculatus]|uniref:Uncharacterized protein n=1 Tax=Portunus trituberculatus TaxID=210409 RepID=A0A5B7DJC2_PORTR|nr:hypothetical protein [Portunus trituberculatus]
MVRRRGKIIKKSDDRDRYFSQYLSPRLGVHLHANEPLEDKTIQDELRLSLQGTFGDGAAGNGNVRGGGAGGARVCSRRRRYCSNEVVSERWALYKPAVSLPLEQGSESGRKVRRGERDAPGGYRCAPDGQVEEGVRESGAGGRGSHKGASLGLTGMRCSMATVVNALNVVTSQLFLNTSKATGQQWTPLHHKSQEEELQLVKGTEPRDAFHNTCLLPPAKEPQMNMIRVLTRAGSAPSVPSTLHISPHQAIVFVHLTGLSLSLANSNYGAGRRCLPFLAVSGLRAE